MTHKYAIGCNVVVVQNKAGGFNIGTKGVITHHNSGEGHHTYGKVYKIEASLGSTRYHFETDLQPIQPQPPLFKEE